MFASLIEAYASVEHSAIRGMYVDPDRLDRSLKRSILIIQIKVCKNLPLKFPQKMAANPKETTAIIRENAADHALRPLFMRFEWTRWDSAVKSLNDEISDRNHSTTGIQ